MWRHAVYLTMGAVLVAGCGDRLADLERRLLASEGAEQQEADEARRQELLARHPELKDLVPYFGTDELRLAQALMSMAGMAALQHDYPRVIQLYRQALALQEERLPADDPALAATHAALIHPLLTEHEAAAAERHARRTLAILDAKPEIDPASRAMYLQLASAAFRSNWRLDEAEVLGRDAVALWEEVRGPRHGAVAGALLELGETLDAQFRPAEAEGVFRRAVAIEETANQPGHPLVALALLSLGRNLHSQARYAEAENAYRRGLAIHEQIPARDRDHLVPYLMGLGTVLADEARYADAERTLQRVRGILTKHCGRTEARALADIQLADLYKELGRFEEAHALLHPALKTLEARFPGDADPALAGPLRLLGTTHAKLGDMESALQELERAHAIDRAAVGDMHPRTAADLLAMGSLQMELGNAAEADHLVQRALDTFSAAWGDDHPTTASARRTLAALRLAQHRPSEAVDLGQRVLAVDERIFGPAHPRIARDLLLLTKARRAIDPGADVAPLCERATAILEATYPPDHPEVQKARELCGAPAGEPAPV